MIVNLSHYDGNFAAWKCCRMEQLYHTTYHIDVFASTKIKNQCKILFGKTTGSKR